MITFEWHGETLSLLPDRALLLPNCKTVVIADWHLGKGHVFRRNGIPVPQGITDQDLARIDRILAHTGARDLAILGDLLHGPVEGSAAWLGKWRHWRATHPRLRIRVACGNHDHQISALAGELDECTNQLNLGRVHGVHEASRGAVPQIAGHIHPYRTLRAPGIRERVPVFWLKKHSLILPAFGRFTGGEVISPLPDERTFAALPEAVLAL